MQVVTFLSSYKKINSRSKSFYFNGFPFKGEEVVGYCEGDTAQKVNLKICKTVEADRMRHLRPLLNYIVSISVLNKQLRTNNLENNNRKYKKFIPNTKNYFKNYSSPIIAADFFIC